MSGLSSIWVYQNIDYLKNTTGAQNVFFWVLISFSMGISLIPTSFVALVSGFIWGFASILPLIISYIFATGIGYFLSKVIDNQLILSEINKNGKAKRLLENLQTDQFKIIALARLSPIFPFGISNVVFTYLGISLQKLILAGIIGMLPRTIFMIWVGHNSQNVIQLLQNNWIDYISSPLFLLGVISSLLIVYIIFNALKKTKDK
ncbi:MAG: VTT domain-containing protein [Bacteroidota bacterium]